MTYDVMSFARLAVCSRVLYEREVVEQQKLIKEQAKEIKSLKFEIFSYKYSLDKLWQILLCQGVRRLSEDLTLERGYMWLRPLIDSCGLELVVVDEHHAPRSELDVHFVCRFGCCISSYGAKLWKATSVDDPELMKLKALFDMLV